MQWFTEVVAAAKPLAVDNDGTCEKGDGLKVAGIHEWFETGGVSDSMDKNSMHRVLEGTT